MLGRMASAARLGTSGGADLSSETATKDADATQAAQSTSDDGPAASAGGTSAAAAAASVTTAAQQHPNLIGTIVGKMTKIQREGRGRRYRVSCSFGVACEWPVQLEPSLRRNWYKFYVGLALEGEFLCPNRWGLFTRYALYHDRHSPIGLNHIYHCLFSLFYCSLVWCDPGITTHDVFCLEPTIECQ